jgi:hypothetical protein
MALKELHFALVLFGRFARIERSQVPPFASFGILFARVKPVFAGLELANHKHLPHRACCPQSYGLKGLEPSSLHIGLQLPRRW